MNSIDQNDYLFTPSIPSLAIADSDQRFPVRRVYCVGRNYAEHAREMGHDPDREPPFFFTKHPDSLLPDGSVFPYPTGTESVHHEIEMVVAIGRGGADIPVEQALEHVYGYAVGLDMTRRDLQAEAKKMGRPWAVAKSFDHAAPCSALVPAEKIGHPTEGRIWLEINGETRQEGDLAELIWSVPEVVAYLSRLFVLEPGDLIMTGTPAGVGPVQRGEHLSGGVQGIGTLDITVG
ncbi:5-carboxymethyl-2-hydroxymuconate isomerase [Stutzerimonas stutzeri]|uniref:5-carboxymethyl-2-hydroxymuconate isomerase n=1 Tax=Stutzerimonas stutzeri TaxID=316 RepID=W8R4J3_STUST|nr:fumarylacetoacetate hydrolase family protein [Stutzerimonas stutzeri]AHL77519.1 5-carboxymethyl-2-hydroxymuconate isomerase [Stutzerimonas stutzeri]MCQ4330417.1 fumarylacetoacetate hydrolase family protein [Stutzerimonas stutzeri]